MTGLHHDFSTLSEPSDTLKILPQLSYNDDTEGVCVSQHQPELAFFFLFLPCPLPWASNTTPSLLTTIRRTWRALRQPEPRKCADLRRRTVLDDWCLFIFFVLAAHLDIAM